MRTVLLLMAEIGRGVASPWHAYVETLPESTDCVMAWGKADRMLLEGPCGSWLVAALVSWRGMAWIAVFAVLEATEGARHTDEARNGIATQPPNSITQPDTCPNVNHDHHPTQAPASRTRASPPKRSSAPTWGLSSPPAPTSGPQRVGALVACIALRALLPGD